MNPRHLLQARSKLPKKRRRVLPVEQPRRKRDASASNRRVNAVKHPVVLKDLPPGGNKFGELTFIVIWLDFVKMALVTVKK